MLNITLQYIPVQYDVAFLRIKQNVIYKTHYQLAFFTYVFSSMFALIAGFTQFSNKIRLQYSSVHKIMGYIYFISILIFSAPSGLIMAYYANGGFSSQISFIILALLWWIFTFLAVWFVLKKNFKKHEIFIYLSYALTLSAITLRLWKYAIANTLAPAPMDLYRIVAWLGWIPNLLIAIFIIYKKNIYEKNN